MSNYEFWNELGNIFDAVLAYQKKNIEFNKTFITPWVRLGHVFPQEESSQKDFQAILHAAELDPENSRIWSDLGDAFHKKGNFEEAVEAYRKAIELDPAAAWPKSNLALTLDAQGRHQEAILLYRESLERFSDDRDKAVIWNRLGNSFRKLGDFENAVGAFLKADDLDAKTLRHRDPMIESLGLNSDEGYPKETPETPGEDVVTQDFTFELHSTDQIIAEKSEEEQFPLMNSRFDSKATSFFEQGPEWEISNSADSKPELNRVMKMGTGLNLVEEDAEVPVPSDIGLNEYSLQDLASNLEMKEETPSSGVDFPSLGEPASLTETEINSKQMNDSNIGQATVDPAAPSDSNQPEPDELKINHIAYEEYLRDFVKPAPMIDDETTEQLPRSNAVAPTANSGESGIQFDTQNEQVWNELGNVYFNSGAYDDAIMAYRQALELDPKFAWAYSNLALVYVQKGRFGEAVLLYKRSIELFKNDRDKASTWNRLGNLYRRQQDYDSAILAYQTADEIDPENVSLLLRSRFSLLGNLLEEQPAYSS